MKIINYIFLLFILVNFCHAQDDDYIKTTPNGNTINNIKKDSLIIPEKKWKKFVREKVSFGGNLGLGFSNGLIVQLNPLINVKINKYIFTGLNLNYTYLGRTFNLTSAQLFGASPFIQIRPIPIIILHGEFQNLFVKYSNNSTITKLPSNYIAGAGINYNIGGRFYANVLILWGFGNTLNVPNPIIRTGIFYGF